MCGYEEMNVVWIHDLLPQYNLTLLRYFLVKLFQILCNLSHENRSSVFRAPYEVIIDAITQPAALIQRSCFAIICVVPIYKYFPTRLPCPPLKRRELAATIFLNQRGNYSQLWS
mgnify:CR=1 FL=1